MAPVKRSTTTAQRETRATRAATVAKKKVTSLKDETKPTAKTAATSNTTRPSTSSRSVKKAVDEQPDEAVSQELPEQTMVVSENVPVTRTRTTRGAATSVGMAAAPRRRVKITPLNASVSEKPAVSDAKKSTKAKSSSIITSKKPSTRSRATDVELAPEYAEEANGSVTTSRSTRKATSNHNDEQNTDKQSSKTKGRKKTQKAEEAQAESRVLENTSTTRATRSQRAESTASSELPVLADATQTSKPVTGARKKVTFLDLQGENDKENQPLPSTKAKKGTTKKTSDSTTSTTGLRAKPLRKAAPNSTSTRGRKAASVATKAAVLTEDTEATNERRMPQALTPKKITQVAKSSSPEHEASDSEDELNGGKTPIRDLSVSPRRLPTAALVRAMSSAKKLDFAQSLVPKSPEKTAVFKDTTSEQAGMLASPARRPAASPFKDGLKDSPKRGLNEAAKLLFPIHADASSSTIMHASTANSGAQNMATILQSPKRTGVLDANFFSQSAMKKSVTKSPFKASLFGTPAKRLFSPAKKVSMVHAEEASLQEDKEADRQDNAHELESEVTASSHFRSSLSPLRVVRVNRDVADTDFDDSVLQVRSPPKVQRSPPKVQKSPAKMLLNFNSDLEKSTEKPSSHVDTIMMTASEDLTKPLTLDPANASLSKEANESQIIVEEPSLEAHADSGIVAQDTGCMKANHQPMSVSRPRVSQVLFRSNRPTSHEDSSEDELAMDQTPAQSLAKNRKSVGDTQRRSRLSTGVPRSVQGKGFGFTPLAAQMSGWLASSPEKSPEQNQNQSIRRESADFSPLARQHVDGEVMISRDATPVQRLNKSAFSHPVSTSRLALSNRKSLGLRKSLAQRQSLGLSSSTGSPARNQQFEEYMEIRAMEEAANTEDTFEEPALGISNDDFDQIMSVENQMADDADETILVEGSEDSDGLDTAEPGDLTTDLIKFTHASDTAMVDFRQLAAEADEMASDESDIPRETLTTTEAKEHELLTQHGTPATAVGLEHNTEQLHSPPIGGVHEELDTEIIQEEIPYEAESPLLKPTDAQLQSPSMLVIDHDGLDCGSPSSAVESSPASTANSAIIRTPQPNLRLNEKRIINTVVSKIPLKPEGAISPIKMPRKRSRSFGNSDGSPAKRISFGNLRTIPAVNAAETVESPNRRVRTSVAPSPGGTSTPATCKSRASRYSLGGLVTPGQTSFMIDDFGDSTLDGIELPEDFEDVTELNDAAASPAPSEQNRPSVSAAATPKSTLSATPATAKRSVRRATTPATATRKVSKSAQKTPSRASTNTAAERTPLVPISNGVLHGATVFVDVHTSEGADASGVFIELLTQMGAKCVRDWRWNSRTSLAANDENEATEPKVGITHVVFKDGGKRTLEKVREAKGEVCCIGVAWVLDCERENKWLDESSYTIDTSILPRGGSKRRKSMEPRALLIANDGSVSASRPRRSVSAEMTELMKRDLMNTPARGQSPAASHENDDDDDENDENVEQSTPTGFVSYDPRVAMTPGTPYLVSQGKKIVQMSAPPKQQNKSLFDDDEDEENNDDTFVVGEKGNSGAVKDAKRFRMKNLGDIAKRRRTLGFKPAVGSPLGRN